MKRICDILGSTALLEGLTHELYHDFCSTTNIRTVWKGEVIAEEGSTARGVYVILEGQIAEQKHSSSGEFTTINLYGPLEMFGEDLVFATRKKYQTTFEAVTNSKLVFLSREQLLAMISKSAQLLHNFMRVLSDRLTAQKRRINLLSQKSLRQKIASYLLDLLHDQLEQNGQTFEEASRVISTHAVELPVSKEVVSRLLAMPRPSFSRELISMERDGLIRVSGRVIWLMDVESLAKGLIEGFITA
ncbi:MAG TPA: Crp/Fnr family transcriptional regulator [Fastidiosipila sp.]|jgi:CRP-like cAMP-binding protein|nr:Crp/Fnr family transcriptional regulator [Fastidiosipila sp.]